MYDRVDNDRDGGPRRYSKHYQDDGFPVRSHGRATGGYPNDNRNHNGRPEGLAQGIMRRKEDDSRRHEDGSGGRQRAGCSAPFAGARNIDPPAYLSGKGVLRRRSRERGDIPNDRPQREQPRYLRGRYRSRSGPPRPYYGSAEGNYSGYDSRSDDRRGPGPSPPRDGRRERRSRSRERGRYRQRGTYPIPRYDGRGHIPYVPSHYTDSRRSRSPSPARRPYRPARSRARPAQEYEPYRQNQKPKYHEPAPTSPSAADSDDESRDDTVGHYQGKEGDIIADRYKLVKDVGLGTFGRVVQCHDHRDHRDVAIKIVRSVRKYTDSAAIEAKVLEDIRKAGRRGLKYCVDMHTWFDYQGHCCLVFETLSLSLYEYLKAHDFVPFPLDYVCDFARQLLEALNFLRSICLIHTDLKPENILLIDSGTVRRDGKVIPASSRVKVIDFGGATYDWDEQKSTIVNTRQYRAPEVILEVGWSYPSDLWSTGCIISELYTGDLFFATHNNLEHIALMERCLQAFPRWMLEQSQESSKYFDVRRGDCIWRSSLDKESQRHVRKQKRPEEVFGQDAGLGLSVVVSGLLTIDPNHRLTAQRALDMPIFRASNHRLAD